MEAKALRKRNFKVDISTVQRIDITRTITLMISVMQYNTYLPYLTPQIWP
jgi:hypothetical protein